MRHPDRFPDLSGNLADGSCSVGGVQLCNCRKPAADAELQPPFALRDCFPYKSTHHSGMNF